LEIEAGDSVVLTHAHHLSPAVSMAVSPFNRSEIDGLVRQEANAQLERESSELREMGLTCRHELLDGMPVATLVAATANIDADLVVIGTLGHTGLAHLLLGSTAERVAERAPCPVLVVPARAVAPAEAANEEPAAAAPAPVASVDEQC